MIYATAAQVQQDIERYQDAAQRQPVRVRSDVAPDVVIIPADHYAKLVAAGVQIPVARRGASTT